MAVGWGELEGEVAHDPVARLRELEGEAAEVGQAHLLGVLVLHDVPETHELLQV